MRCDINPSQSKLQTDPLRAKTGGVECASHVVMIRKLKPGEYRLYSRKKNPKTGKRRNLGTFSTRAAATKHEQEVQYFKKR